ncbi:DUF4261 domain-containing protein [Roseiconus lacunae]|uniref:DUF4261 domain-containing protein n=1 Tax=Roseiconus lacunae TaxID=2605694 RepID=A0ABT7PDN2_9BACT|nr:DUF4261 domain-containing protein [Roseiconus lacunae]MCD0459622.1 DUF4261 domain-containing protein [Roseiconus lacunae]MDM4014321.1 DUF4261 domain-containing protein [Roseiconus lacunae]WRQ49636.1 DUF4261 domain-containing protein [Stieleria sp. HD01]
MAKGLFTQGMCVLFREPVSLEKLQQSLTSFELIGVQESVVDNASPETLVMKFRPEVGGHLLVTPSTEKWPDDMGDPETTPDVFVAWSLGQFGPLAFPGCLQRAAEQAWTWDEAEDAVAEHSCHVRLLISYVLGSENEEQPDDDSDDVVLIPDDYNAVEELMFLMKGVSELLELPEAICYFNPGGEILQDQSGLRQGLNFAWNYELPPLDMWANVRLFRSDDAWALMDIVGMGQLDLPDMEAVYDTNKYDPEDVERFLRTASMYLMNSTEEFQDGDSADGPGDLSWIALECDDSLSDPPRETIRWIPDDGSEPPEALLRRAEVDLDDPFDDEPDDLDDEAFEA